MLRKRPQTRSDNLLLNDKLCLKISNILQNIHPMLMLDAFEYQIIRTLLLRNITKTVKDITSYACDVMPMIPVT